MRSRLDSLLLRHKEHGLQAGLPTRGGPQGPKGNLPRPCFLLSGGNAALAVQRQFAEETLLFKSSGCAELIDRVRVAMSELISHG